MNLVPSNFFTIRLPLFNLEKLEMLDQAYIRKDLQKIIDIVSDKPFLNAIYFSSREFHKVLTDWIANENSKNFEQDARILESIYKYYVRICTRPTPYGLFAGFASSTINDHNTSLKLANSHRPIFRVDMMFIEKLKTKLFDSVDDLKKVELFTNNTLTKSGDKLRFISADSDFNYEINEIDNSQFISEILKTCKNGSRFDDILNILHQYFPEESLDTKLNFIEELKSNQILEDNLPPYLTSLNDPLLELDHYLKKLNINQPFINDFKKITSQSQTNINIPLLEEISEKYGISEEKDIQAFQIDVKINFNKANINKKVAQVLMHEAEELQRINEVNKNPKLLAFTRRYLKKFGDQAIPLQKALDPQLGVGYDLHVSGNVEERPLTDNVYFSYPNENRAKIPSVLKEVVLNRMEQLANESTIHLTEKDFPKQQANINKGNYCSSYYLFGQLFAGSFKEIDKGNFKFYCNSGIPTPYASNILARFAYHDEVLTEKLKNLERDKNNTDIIQAELIHHPNYRLGNVLLRPNLYDYSIPYKTTQANNTETINIALEDILVSVNSEKITLFSKFHQKEIIPRMTSAYNHSINQLALVRFLGDLQFHNKISGFKWDWSFLQKKSFLPRIEYKHLILAEAQWRLNKDEHCTIPKLTQQLQLLKVPDYFTIKDADNVLLLSKKNTTCLQILLKRIKKNSIVLYESFKDSFLELKKGEHFASEIILAAGVKDNFEKNKTRFEFPQPNVDIQRTFYPGSEWTSLKIYCSHASGDKVIKNIFQMLDQLHVLQDKQWFFLRYEDPEFHIRLRIKISQIDDLLKHMNFHLKDLIANGEITDLKIDSYHRELERYGYKYIHQTEQLFHLDSISVAQFLNENAPFENEEFRWKASIISIDKLLDAFSMDDQTRMNLFESLYQTFMPEFVDIQDDRLIKKFKTSLDQKYRKHSKEIDQLLRLKDYKSHKATAHLFETRKRKSSAITAILLNDPDLSITNLLSSHIHMTINRIHHTKARMQELIIYYFLHKAYTSIYKRKLYANN